MLLVSFCEQDKDSVYVTLHLTVNYLILSSVCCSDQSGTMRNGDCVLGRLGGQRNRENRRLG